jgi:hypothetical protein
MISHVQQQKFRHLFDVFDFNDNKVINQEDVMFLFKRLEATSPNPKAAYKAANSWWRVISEFSDKNNDEKITTLEWGNWTQALVNELQMVETSSEYFQHFEYTLFEAIEIETEGGYKTITVEEYQKWMDAFQLKGDAAELFAKLDSQGAGAGDGEIFKSEFRDLLIEFFLSEDQDAPGNYLWGDPFKKKA